MVTLEQKLNLFKKIVDEKVQKDIDQQITQKDDEISEYLAKEKKLLESNAERMQKSAMDRIKRQKSETISTMIQKQRKDFLKLNEEVLSDLMTRIESKLRSFMEQEEYPAFLEKTVKNALTSFEKEASINVYLAPAAFTTSKAVLEKILLEEGFNHFKIKEGEVSYIGGFVIENEERTIRINKTFADALSMKKDDIGQMLHDYIRKGV